MGLHLDVGLVIHCVKILLKVIGVVLLPHFFFEFIVEAVGLLVGRVGLLGKLEPLHLLVILRKMVASSKIHAADRSRHSGPNSGCRILESGRRPLDIHACDFHRFCDIQNRLLALESRSSSLLFLPLPVLLGLPYLNPSDLLSVYLLYLLLIPLLPLLLLLLHEFLDQLVDLMLNPIFS